MPREGGRPVSAIARVRARDMATGAILAHGQSGAIEIRAPSQMMGYLGDDRATQGTFTGDGFVRTGDLGYTLADGRFIYQARMGDELRLAGFLVSPAQIEAVIEEHPSVQACQVVGIDTPRGTRPIAFVIGKPGIQFDAQAIGAFARARMAHYKVPERIVRLDAFPTVQSANAVKIQKAKLREMAHTIANEH